MNRSRPQLLLFFLLLVPYGASAGAIEDINGIRLAAGLAALSRSAPLMQAAQAHADYLARYVPQGGRVAGSAHEESSGLPEFTGHLAPERAMHAGYPHALVTENVSIGNSSSGESVSSLMSAIYHRFAFLDPLIDEIGFAQAQNRYVFNMGRKDIATACSAQPDEAAAAAPFDCLGRKLKGSAYKALCTSLPEEARFSPPYGNRCANGVLLQQAFMAQLCENPPAAAILKGAGRYFDACGNGLKIRASWFDQVCRSHDPAIVYPHTGASYQICTPPVAVHADWYQEYCANLPGEMLETDSGGYYKFCANGFPFKSEYYTQLDREKLLRQSEAILWPADEVNNIQPVFYTEDPHPTPDLPQSGYPISIQFNPARVETIMIMGFTLEQQSADTPDGWAPVDGMRMIDQQSDLNQEFSAYQFAWFPLQRLKWDTRYRYHVDALVDGVFKRYDATFTTTRLPVPVYEVSGEKQQVTVAEGHFILYREPDAYDSEPFKSVGLRYRDRPRVDVNVIDTNTLEVNAAGSSCAPLLIDTRLAQPIQVDFCR